MAAHPQVLYLLPGLLCDASIWARQVTAMRGDIEVCVPVYGSCRSITEMAASVLANAPEQFAVAGHSMGARVAMEMVRISPERVSRLALLDTGAHTVRKGEAEQRKKLVNLAFDRGMRELATVWLPGMMDERRLTDQWLLENLEAMVGRFTPEQFEMQVEALLARPNAEAHLREIRCPVLLGVGRNDRWSPLAQHEEIAKQIPQAKLVVFEDSGHMSPVEAPTAVTQALLWWLSDYSTTFEQCKETKAWAMLPH